MSQITIPTQEYIDQKHNEQMEAIARLEDKINSSISDQERLVSRSELANNILGVSESTVDNMRRKGIIKAYYLGVGVRRGKPKFRVSEVFESLKQSA